MSSGRGWLRAGRGVRLLAQGGELGGVPVAQVGQLGGVPGGLVGQGAADGGEFAALLGRGFAVSGVLGAGTLGGRAGGVEVGARGLQVGGEPFDLGAVRGAVVGQGLAGGRLGGVGAGDGLLGGLGAAAFGVAQRDAGEGHRPRGPLARLPLLPRAADAEEGLTVVDDAVHLLLAEPRPRPAALIRRPRVGAAGERAARPRLRAAQTAHPKIIRKTISAPARRSTHRLLADSGLIDNPARLWVKATESVLFSGSTARCYPRWR